MSLSEWCEDKKEVEGTRLLPSISDCWKGNWLQKHARARSNTKHSRQGGRWSVVSEDGLGVKRTDSFAFIATDWRVPGWVAASKNHNRAHCSRGQMLQIGPALKALRFRIRSLRLERESSLCSHSKLALANTLSNNHTTEENRPGEQHKPFAGLLFGCLWSPAKPIRRYVLV